MTLRSLRERVEMATGPDRALELDLWRMLDGGHMGKEPLPWLKCYTESIDAALSLVEKLLPGWEYHIASKDGTKGPYAKLATVNLSGNFEVRAATPALAILACLLRALESKEAKS